MVEVSRNGPKQVLLLDPGKWVLSRDGSCAEDRVVVAVKRESQDWKKVKVNNLWRGQSSGGRGGGQGEQQGGGCCLGSPGTLLSPRWKRKFRLEDSESELPKLSESW